MTQLRANGIAIEYEELGHLDAPVLLSMGRGGQLILWPEAYAVSSPHRGFRVIPTTMATSASRRRPRQPPRQR